MDNEISQLRKALGYDTEGGSVRDIKVAEGSKAGAWIKGHVGTVVVTFLVSGVLLGGWLYAVTTSWKSEQKLATQAEQLGQIRGDLTEIKKTFIQSLARQKPQQVGDTQRTAG